MNLVLRIVLTIVAVCTCLVIVPAAHADGGRTAVVSCGSFQSPASGTAHARIRNCEVVFSVDDAGRWDWKVSFEFKDAAVDGMCAAATAGTANAVLRECDGAWKPVVIRPMPDDYSEPAYFWYVRIALWYQKSNGSNPPQGMVKKCVDNPLRVGDGCAG